MTATLKPLPRMMMMLPSTTPTYRQRHRHLHRRGHKVEAIVVDDAPSVSSSCTTTTIPTTTAAAATAKAMLVAMILLAAVTCSSSTSTSITSSIITPAITVVVGYCAPGPFCSSFSMRFLHHRQRRHQYHHQQHLSSSSSSSSSSLTKHHPSRTPPSQLLHNQRQQQGGGGRRRQRQSSSQSFFYKPTTVSTTTTATGTQSMLLPLSSSSSTFMVASVPPPNSRLGRNLLLKQQMQQQQQQQQLQSTAPPMAGRSRSGSSNYAAMGASRSRSTITTTGINSHYPPPKRGYFDTYGSIYTRYCSVGNNGDDEDNNLIHSNNKEDHNDFTEDREITQKETSTQQYNDTDVDIIIHHNEMKQQLRSPMLRFMNNGSRLRCLPRHDGKHVRQSNSNTLSKHRTQRQRQRRRRRRQRNESSTSPSRLDYERRKAEWAAKYTSVSTLRKSFGSNKNRIWGDFDPVTTRKLYHTLLPRALLELRILRDGLVKSSFSSSSSLTTTTTSFSSSATNKTIESDGEGNDRKKGRRQQQRRRTWNRPKQVDNTDDYEFDDIDKNTYLQQELKELAPLAYRARLAAKEYARERCILPARIGSMLYDGYRSWRRYGKWNRSGMTWEQIWNKYEDQVLREVQQASGSTGEGLSDGSADAAETNFGGSSMREDEELTARICLRILERSVVTNEAIDRLFLKSIAVEDVSKTDINRSRRVGTSPTSDGKLDEKRKQQRRQQQQQRRRKLVRQLRRKLQIQADLQAIEKKFDDDIRELLRFSNLASSEGEERRSRRRGGAFFWKKSNESDREVDSVVTPSTPIPIHGAASRSDLVEGSSLTVISDGAQSALTADVALRGGTADHGILNSTDVDTNMYSISETTVTMNLPQSAVGSSEQRRERVKNMDAENQSSSVRKLAAHEVITLRVLASTKQRIASLQVSPHLGGEGEDSADTEA